MTTIIDAGYREGSAKALSECALANLLTYRGCTDIILASSSLSHTRLSLGHCVICIYTYWILLMGFHMTYLGLCFMTNTNVELESDAHKLRVDCMTSSC